MTENEALNELELNKPFVGSKALNNAIDMAIQALEEIQAYRAIGTVEDFKAYKLGDCMNHCEHYDNCSNYIYSKGYNKAIDDFAEKIIIMMPGHRQDIEQVAEQMKGEKND